MERYNPARDTESICGEKAARSTALPMVASFQPLDGDGTRFHDVGVEMPVTAAFWLMPARRTRCLRDLHFIDGGDHIRDTAEASA